MFAVLGAARNPLTRLLALLAVVALAACEPVVGGGSGPALDPNAPVQVALLLPTGSGSDSDETLARSLRQAAEMAIADLGGVRIDLRVYSSGADAAQAAAAATRAVDDGAKIILGPVFAEAANAAGLAVANRNVNVLAFSNNTSIAGGNVFLLGSTFDNTAARLANYASSQGRKRILIVHDATPSGDVARAAVAAAIQRSGAVVAGVVSYEFSQSAVIQAVPQIAAQVRSTGADAIFLTADTAGALPLLAQMLPGAGVDPQVVRYIGLTRWDIPRATLSYPGLQNGWFALPDPGLNAQFQSRYLANYGEVPNPIAGLAYDGIAAIGALVKSGRPDALSRAALTQQAGFAGVTGVFRFLPNGTNQRGLAVAEVRNAAAVTVDPAPRSFGRAGF